MTRTEITENTPIVFKSASLVVVVGAIFFAGMKANDWKRGLESKAEDGSAAMTMARENRALLEEMSKQMQQQIGELKSIKELLAQNLRKPTEG